MHELSDDYVGGSGITPTVSGEHCVEMICAEGEFQRGCECLPCPAGTYRDNSMMLCAVCGSPDVYCPEGATAPILRTAGYCTIWSPYPSAKWNPTRISPSYYDDVGYYSYHYGNPSTTVLFSDGTQNTIDAFWTDNEMDRQVSFF